MNIKYVSLLTILCVTSAQAIMPDEIIDVSYGRYARAHIKLAKCQELKNFWGNPCQCTDEKSKLAIKSDEFNKVMSKMKNFLETTVQQGDEATIFERSKKQKAQRAKETISRIQSYQQQPREVAFGTFSRDVLCYSSKDAEIIKAFHNDLYKTIPSFYDYDFMMYYVIHQKMLR